MGVNIWLDGCMGLHSSRIIIHMHGCNGLGWHGFKKNPWFQTNLKNNHGELEKFKTRFKSNLS